MASFLMVWMASQWYTPTNFHKLYPMVKTASSFLLITSIHESVRFGAYTHTDNERNGVLFDGVESNGGVRASKFDQ